MGRGRGAGDEVVFLDDIGENLKAARERGFGTIKVDLGRRLRRWIAWRS